LYDRFEHALNLSRASTKRLLGSAVLEARHIPMQRERQFRWTDPVSPGVTPIRTALRSAITNAIKQRDRAALTAYRTALAAIDNAEAVPVGGEHRAGSIERSAAGVGRADAPRRGLNEQDMVEIVRREAGERRATADALGTMSPEAADQLRREADLLLALLQ